MWFFGFGRTKRVERKLDALTVALGKDFCKLMADIQKIGTDEQDTLAAVTELQVAVGKVATAMSLEVAALASAKDEIAALKAQIANGSPVTQEQLDDLDAKIVTNTTNIRAQVQALMATLPPAENPPSETP